MKGFIEVTKRYYSMFADVIVIPLSDIKEVRRVADFQCKIIRNDNSVIKVENHYKEVKQLIKQATEL